MKRAAGCIFVLGFIAVIAVLAVTPGIANAQHLPKHHLDGTSLQVRYELFAAVSTTLSEDSAKRPLHQPQRTSNHKSIQTGRATQSTMQQRPIVTGFEKMYIQNNGAASVRYIRLRLYPNSYSSDSTLLSEALLRKGDLRLYFASPEGLGRISQLNFTTGDPSQTGSQSPPLALLRDPANPANPVAGAGETCLLQLPAPLAPGDSIMVQTPFLLELPDRIIDLGYDKKTYTSYLKDWFVQVYDGNDTAINPATASETDTDTVAEIVNAEQPGDAIQSVSISLHIQRSEAMERMEAMQLWVDGVLQTPGSVSSSSSSNNNNIHTQRFDLLLAPHATLALTTAGHTPAPAAGPIGAAPRAYGDPNAAVYFKKLLPGPLLASRRPVRPDSLMAQMIAARNGDTTYTGLQKKLTPAFLFNLKEADTKKYLSFSPALGFNDYDKWMPGILIHNYGLPASGFNFLLAPIYSTGDHSLSGLGRLSYTERHPGSAWQISIDGSDYAFDQYSSWTDASDNLHQGGKKRLLRIVPALRYKWSPRARDGDADPGAGPEKFWSVAAKAYFLRTDSWVAENDELAMGKINTTIGELSAALTDNRALYPYRIALKLQGTDAFLRAGLTGNYFLNYDAKGNGLQMRAFAGKFFYLNDKNDPNSFSLPNYFFNLSGATGQQDFTNSDYFIGRSAYEGWMSQQMAVSDGFFKVSTPYQLDPVGQSDDWLAAVNLTTDLPEGVNPFAALPFRLPVRLFADIGTYGNLWSETPAAGRFLYDAGVQVSVLKEAVTIYFPLLYSKIYRDTYKSMADLGSFAHRIRFSISLENLLPKRLHQNVQF